MGQGKERDGSFLALIEIINRKHTVAARSGEVAGIFRTYCEPSDKDFHDKEFIKKFNSFTCNVLFLSNLIDGTIKETFADGQARGENLMLFASAIKEKLREVLNEQKAHDKTSDIISEFAEEWVASYIHSSLDYASDAVSKILERDDIGNLDKKLEKITHKALRVVTFIDQSR